MYFLTGGIAIDAFSTVTIDDSSFIANSVSDPVGPSGSNEDPSGGAVYYFGILRDDNTLAVRKSYFERNVASFGAALALYGNGISLESCTFTANTATTSDAVVGINVAENVDISDCVFFSHQVGVLSIQSSREIRVRNCNVSSTNSTTSAVYIETAVDVAFESCIFAKNQARSGGAFYVTSSQNINIESSTFIGNSVVSSGGGLYVDDCSYVEVNDTYFEGNFVYSGASIDVYNSGGGMFVSSSDHLTIQNNTFSHNSAGTVNMGSGGSKQVSMYNSGGALFIRQTNIIFIEDNVFSQNSAGSSVGLLFNSGGGLFMIDTDYVEVNDNTFSKNSAGSASGGDYNSGGGMFVTATTDLSLRRNAFLKNTAEYGGGGGVFYVASSGTSIETATNGFAGNTALYGRDQATDAISLTYRNPQQSNDIFLNSFDHERTYIVELVDLYGNIVANLYALVTATADGESSCGTELAYISGQTTAELTGGM
jgi:predicted outer membrane repeat protein